MTKLWISREENLKSCEDLLIHKNNPQSYAQESLFVFNSLTGLYHQFGQDYYSITTTFIYKK